jgi:hypothetical protein
VGGAVHNASGEFGSFNNARYFSLASFTTLGATELTLPPAHRMVGAFESAAGMMMFGWSTALLVPSCNAPTAGRCPRGACSCEQRCRP